MDWLTDFAANVVRRPRRGAERVALRDAEIALYVAFIAMCTGLPPTRNAASEAHSVCDALAEAFGMSYPNVVRIWQERRDSRIAGIGETCDGMIRFGAETDAIRFS